MTDVDVVLVIFSLLMVKHLVVDFPLQGPYQYMNKGTYGHPGGVQHSAWHGYATFMVLYWFVPVDVAVALAVLDMAVHYHIDWAKVNVTKKLGYGPTTHEQFWWLLGVDQFLHMMTYVGIVALAVK